MAKTEKIDRFVFAELNLKDVEKYIGS